MRATMIAVLTSSATAATGCSTDPEYTQLQGTWREVGGKRVLYLDGSGGGLLDPIADVRGTFGEPCRLDGTCSAGTCTTTTLSLAPYDSDVCTEACEPFASEGKCPSGTSCRLMTATKGVCMNEFDLAPFPVQVTTDPFLKWQFRTSPSAAFDANRIFCWTCEVVEDGRKITCKSKADEPGAYYPTTCEFERISDSGPPAAADAKPSTPEGK